MIQLWVQLFWPKGAEGEQSREQALNELQNGVMS